MAELTSSYRCFACDHVYEFDPGVCGVCFGSEFVKVGDVDAGPVEDTVAVEPPAASPAPSGLMCVDCKTVYQIDPGVCGICSGSEFVKTGDEDGRPLEEAAAVEPPAAPPTPSEFVLCACGQPVPVGQERCEYCGEPVIQLTDRMTLTRSLDGGRCSVARLVAPDGTQVPLNDGVPVVFGRSPDESPWARLAEGNFMVSRRHAEIVVSQGILHVRDLCSTNGTWVRGIKIDGAAAVEIEDGIRIGLSRHLELVVRLA